MANGIRAATLLLGGLLAAAPLAAAEDVARPLRVLAVGDSVTVGVGSSHGAGYRLTFWNRMQEAGIHVKMVGGKQDGPDGFDARHQGYKGSKAYEISAAMPEKMRRHHPDVVLLLIGINDADQQFSPIAFQVNFSVLVDRVFSANRDVKLLVGTIPPQKYGKNEDATLHMNGLLARFVAERAADGQAIALVDVYSVIDSRKDMADGLHPNDAGYEKIGDAFADALLGMLGSDLAG